VTLLFTDMCGFTAFSKERKPTEVVRMLSELFSKFDSLCLKHNVYKVHTIGDCYVILGYTGKVSNDKRDIE
jgi:class 3 adenylate cyclase